MKLFITLFIALFLTGCSLTVYPDGTRSWVIDSQIAKAIIVHEAK